MPRFIVEKPCRPNVEYKAPGDEVTLTQAQAKYLLMSGHLKPQIQKIKPKAKKPDNTKKADA